MYVPFLLTTPHRSASPSLASPISDEVSTTFCCNFKRFFSTGSGWSIPGNIGSWVDLISVILFELLEHKEDKYPEPTPHIGSTTTDNLEFNIESIEIKFFMCGR